MNIVKAAVKHLPAGPLFTFIAFPLNLLYLCPSFIQEITIVKE
jgi:hypothetical protein